MPGNDSCLVLMEHRTVVSVVRELLDPVLVVGLLFYLVFASEGDVAPRHVFLGLSSGALVYWVFGLVGLYRSFRSAEIWAELPRLLLGWGYVVAALAVVGWLSGTSDHYPTSLLLTWITAVPLLLGVTHVASRVILRVLRKRGIDTRKAIIAGTGPLAQAVAQRIHEAPAWGIQVLGAFGDAAPEGSVPGTQRIGPLSGLPEFVKREGVSLVYVALPADAMGSARQLVAALGDTTASIYFVPDVFLSRFTRVVVQDVGGLPAMALCESPFASTWNRTLKRLSDVVLASLMLAAAAVPMLVIALAIKLTSPGPVIFRQRRYGLNGQAIVVYKFRTMRVIEEGTAVTAALRDDPRITRVGAFLRRTSLDELPQILNVLQGTMSLVGPRPLAITQNETFRALIDGYMVRHKVKPGITGWAQINGMRGGDSLDRVRRRVEYDLEYVRNWSPWLDLKIIAKTAFVLFHDDNAY